MSQVDTEQVLKPEHQLRLLR